MAISVAISLLYSLDFIPGILSAALLNSTRVYIAFDPILPGAPSQPVLSLSTWWCFCGHNGSSETFIQVQRGQFLEWCQRPSSRNPRSLYPGYVDAPHTLCAGSSWLRYLPFNCINIVCINTITVYIYYTYIQWVIDFNLLLPRFNKLLDYTVMSRVVV